MSILFEPLNLGKVAIKNRFVHSATYEAMASTEGEVGLNTCRGGVPVDDLAKLYPWWLKPLAKRSLKGMVGKFDLEEGYNVPAAAQIKPVMDGVREWSSAACAALSTWNRCLKRARLTSFR